MAALIQALGVFPARPSRMQATLIARDCTMMTLVARVMLWSERNGR